MKYKNYLHRCSKMGRELLLFVFVIAGLSNLQAQSEPEDNSISEIEEAIGHPNSQTAAPDGGSSSNPNITVHPIYTRKIGQKSYELKDHLGNVRVVISDRKVLKSASPTQQPSGSGSTGASGDYFIAQVDTVDSLSAVAWAERLLVAKHGTAYSLSNMGPAPDRGGGNTWVVKITLGTGAGSPNDEAIAGDYVAEILSSQDYYPFGMQMPGRSFVSVRYRYGFQGQEKDDEVKRSGNSVNYKYRMHDPRLGRFLSVDPLAPEYPWNSVYAFSENRVVDAIELEGREKDLVAGHDPFKPNRWNKSKESKDHWKAYTTGQTGGAIVGGVIALIALTGGEAIPIMLQWARANPYKTRYLLKELGIFTAGLMDPSPPGVDLDPTSFSDEGAKLLKRGVRNLFSKNRLVNEVTVKLYRAICKAELDDILRSKSIGPGPGSFEGKLFTDNLEDAIGHGKNLYPDGNFHIIEVDILESTFDQLLQLPNLDNGLGAISVDKDQIELVNQTLQSVSEIVLSE